MLRCNDVDNISASKLKGWKATDQIWSSSHSCKPKMIQALRQNPSQVKKVNIFILLTSNSYFPKRHPAPTVQSKVHLKFNWKSSSWYHWPSTTWKSMARKVVENLSNQRHCRHRLVEYAWSLFHLAYQLHLFQLKTHQKAGCWWGSSYRKDKVREGSSESLKSFALTCPNIIT